ncbi:MAG TPA: hypothetical protein VGH38_25740 [Bryobacteraceae bacterium]|jgi:hypothetical protein
MAIAKITGPGLAGIGISVALLWGCVIGDRVMVQRASLDRARVMRDVEKLQRPKRPEPVSAPSVLKARPLRVTEG